MPTAHDRSLRRRAGAGVLGILLLGATGCGPAATAASGTTPPGAGPSGGGFVCPSQDQVRAATGLSLTFTKTNAQCAWRSEVDGALANGASIWNPSTSTATTLAAIRARFVAAGEDVVDRPTLGVGSFEAPFDPPAGPVTKTCSLYVMSSNGKVTQIAVHYAGPAKDVCLYAEEIALLVH